MFYVHKQMADGHLGKCITCTKKDVKKRAASPEGRKHIAAYERERWKRPERRAAVAKYQRSRRSGSPGKYAAVTAVCNAIRDGRLVRLPCEVCGDPKSQAHHDDYRRKLKVRWLCFKHHREAHGQTVNGTTP